MEEFQKDQIQEFLFVIHLLHGDTVFINIIEA
jgi:hypothetical protein